MKYTLYIFVITLATGCAVNKQIAKQANEKLIHAQGLSEAHVGISIYYPAEKKFLYNYQGDKYFIPASNIKILSCYAAMKYLGDSLNGLRYSFQKDSTLLIEPTGDPSFLHPDFYQQPVYDFLKSIHRPIQYNASDWHEKNIGLGWSWDDYLEAYMAQRSAFPIYGNIIRIKNKDNQLIINPNAFAKSINKSENILKGFDVQKSWDTNLLTIIPGKHQSLEVPFRPLQDDVLEMLKDTLHLNITTTNASFIHPTNIIHSQPTDSLLKIMMHRSDNFYAEQLLLMVSNERLGVMNDAEIIDTFLAIDFKGMPQKARWVDGSGLSRYNLITPDDFIFVLDKMRNEFDWKRISTIFASGGNGTLGKYYQSLQGQIFAKTGSLSNNTALSGYLITKAGKTLIFSILVSNHTLPASSVRGAVENFLTYVCNTH